ncbi:MAG TPA: response regulator [Caulobacteraceae bacterium]|nr:response regulator [Caulobacteraceae bacterium]
MTAATQVLTPMSPADKVNLDKLAMLVVDNNTQSLDIIAQVIMGFGVHNITKCQTVKEAKAAVLNAPMDFILCDAQLPDEDGYSFLRWLRREAGEPNKYAPAVVVTGHTRISQVMKARDCGAHFTVAKPITPAVLLQRIFWVAKDERMFIDCESYVGPDRRFRRLGPPPGMKGRRSDDLPVEIGESKGPNMDQDVIDALLKPTKVSL